MAFGRQTFPVCPGPNLDSVPLFVGMWERSIRPMNRVSVAIENLFATLMVERSAKRLAVFIY